jgi:acyl-CoA synthetase (AMP-forming)/AMP-acid ligase II
MHLLRRRAARSPDRCAFTFLADGEGREQVWTYARLDHRARAIAARLAQLGAGGQRVLLVYPSGPEFLAGLFGCLYAGAVPVPAYPPRPNRTLIRLQTIVADSQPCLALTQADTLARLQHRIEANPYLKCLAWLAGDEVDDALASQWGEPHIAPDMPALLQYTSGSTSEPKGVVLGHRRLLQNSSIVQAAFEVSEESICVGWLPLFHDMGLIGNVLTALYTGIPAVLMSPEAFLVKPFRWLQAISRYRGTISGGPNFAYDLCARRITPEQRQSLDLSCWEVAFCGSEPIRPETLDQFAHVFAPCGFRREAFYPCYGLAEATLFVAGGARSEAPDTLCVDARALERGVIQPAATDVPGSRTFVSCGRSWGDHNIAIVDPETRTLCPPGHVGEIWIAGPCVADGYWRRPQETEETFQAFLADANAGPYLRTGDLGFVDAGSLFISGRRKDLIIVAGRNHYPQDIEQTVERCHPDLSAGNCACFAVDRGDREAVVVVAELDRHSVRVAPAELDPVFRAIRQSVAEIHELSLDSIVLLPPASIPKTSSGKIQRHLCRRQYCDGLLKVVASQ